ncbi:DUF4190 domain-containing protein [Leucobacter sp. CSA1]|uniref:DUF4190 domain-containing protein n=1 Tax=Leucobacter chromiisoli TaxID=2796471 RepID=A0A934UUP1_9MICO|nr:DUF4190 domain-containing protein [Leucobacter chromiisoli]MBK0418127.1 DUF4190 domain-containing protein [Leucobacter chromiisoli]
MTHQNPPGPGDSQQPAPNGQPTTPFPTGGFEPAPPAPGAPVPPAPPVGAPGQPYGAPQPGGPEAPMNPLALVSFIGSFFVSLVGIICGHIALKQIKRDGTRGRGFALAGTIIGYVALAGTIIAIIVAVVTASMFAGAVAEEIAKAEEQSQSIEEEPPAADEPAVEDEPSAGAAAPELCDALDRVTEESLSVDATSAEVPQGLVDAYRELAAAGGDHQALYQQVADLLANPTPENGQAMIDLSEELSSAVSEDYMSCL